MARHKSGNYTVRRPLEIGAAMAGCGDQLLTQLGGYGEAVGEAFQLRDDLLGIFGSPTITGKPVGADLTDHKATSVVVAAHQMADPTLRRELAELMSTPELDEPDVGRWRTLIAATGAVQRIEEMITDRLRRASEWIDTGLLDGAVRSALLNMALSARSGRHDAHRRGQNRSRGGGRRRPRGPVGRTAPGRARPRRDRRRTRRRPRRTGRPAGHRRLSARYRANGSHHAGPDRRNIRRRRRFHRRPDTARGRRSRVSRPLRRRQHAGRAQRPRRDGRRGGAVGRPAAGAGLSSAAGLARPVVPGRVRRLHRLEFRLPVIAVDSAARRGWRRSAASGAGTGW